MILTAGNTLEPCTTIIRKLDYDGFTTQGLAVHAAKLLSENKENVHRLSPDRATEVAIGVRRKQRRG